MDLGFFNKESRKAGKKNSGLEGSDSAMQMAARVGKFERRTSNVEYRTPNIEH